MPSWISITLADVRALAANARIEAAFSNDPGDLQTFFETEKSAIIAEVRAAIATCERNQLDVDPETLPPEWKAYAALRILARFLARPGQAEETPYRLTEDQRTELERRTADLERVSKCELAVTQPSTPETTRPVASLASGMSIVGGTRRFTRCEMDGL